MKKFEGGEEFRSSRERGDQSRVIDKLYGL